VLYLLCNVLHNDGMDQVRLAPALPTRCVLTCIRRWTQLHQMRTTAQMQRPPHSLLLTAHRLVAPVPPAHRYAFDIVSNESYAKAGAQRTFVNSRSVSRSSIILLLLFVIKIKYMLSRGVYTYLHWGKRWYHRKSICEPFGGEQLHAIRHEMPNCHALG
jgi:hypothetical protein